MRIDAFNRVSQMYQATSTKKTTSISKTGKPDNVEISQFGRDLQVARAAVAKAPDIREEKVADIKARMEAGSYRFSMDDLAEKLTDGYIF